MLEHIKWYDTYKGKRFLIGLNIFMMLLNVALVVTAYALGLADV